MKTASWEAASIEEAADALRSAQSDDLALLPCGRRSRVARHAPRAQPDAWLSLAGMTAIRSIDPQDQTCEVEAGLSPGALDAALAEHGLQLGVAAPCADRGTLGGLFLAPDVSLLSAQHGPPRDQVLGAEWLLADGSRVRSGARVVKSVAGYDVTRLLLGSRGRLAVCVSLILRLRPRPREEHWYRCAPGQLRGSAPPPGARLGFQVRDGEDAWLQTERVELRGDGLASADPGAGRRALEEALEGFAAAPVRVALSCWQPEATPHGAADHLGAQFAATPAPEVEERWRGRPDWTVLPHRDPSPWLDAVARACAPGVTPLGQRRR